MSKRVAVLVISGPVGVGKTTVGDELTYVLEERGVPHTFVDLDGLTHSFPRPEEDPFGEGLAMQNLRDVWRNSAEAGSRNLLVARVIEHDRVVDTDARSPRDVATELAELIRWEQ